MLAFCNHSPGPVWLAYMFWSPDTCGGEGGDWQTIGWFAIAPGSCSTVYANNLNDVNNRFWYYYAENADRSIVWAGPVEVHVPNEAFNKCRGIATSAERTVFYRQIDVGNYNDVTVNIAP
jgi:uncharacterized membrane protein